MHALVQGWKSGGEPGDNNNHMVFAFDANVTAGNSLYAVIFNYYSPLGATFTVADDVNGSWFPCSDHDGETSEHYGSWHFYKHNVLGGTTTVTVDCTQVGTHYVFMAEFSGGHLTTPEDVKGKAAGAGVASTTAGITSNGPALWLASQMSLTPAAATLNSAGWTNIFDNSSIACAYRIESGAVLRSCSWNLDGSTGWNTAISAFAAAPAGNTDLSVRLHEPVLGSTVF